MQDFYVYILKCNDGSYYIGHTDNIELRISQHRLGNVSGYTSKRLPVEVVYVHPTSSRDLALSLEHQIKKWSRKKKEALIAENWPQLIQLSKKIFQV